jgi:predicted transcriptional regulator of viral defense system
MKVVERAAEQHGYVTQEDARELGVPAMTLVRMAERGQLERVATGLYRVPLLPPSEWGSYMEAVLWPRGTRGVISHESALELYDLSDVNPAKIHITVPRDHRIRREVPAAYVVHRQDLNPDEVTVHEGIPVVTPERAIRELHEAHLGRRLIAQAIDDGQRKGLLTRRAYVRLRDELGITGGAR